MRKAGRGPACESRALEGAALLAAALLAADAVRATLAPCWRALALLFGI